MIDPHALTPEQLARALERVQIIRAWCDGVESAARTAIIEGQQIPGYRLGWNHPRKKWTDPTRILDMCKAIKGWHIDTFAPRQVVTPSQLLKLLKQSKISDKPFKKFITRNDRQLVVTEVDNTYYDDVNAVDLAAWQSQQGSAVAVTAKLPRKKK